jgi:hypothetical protein
MNVTVSARELIPGEAFIPDPVLEVEGAFTGSVDFLTVDSLPEGIMTFRGTGRGPPLIGDLLPAMPAGVCHGPSPPGPAQNPKLEQG